MQDGVHGEDIRSSVSNFSDTYFGCILCAHSIFGEKTVHLLRNEGTHNITTLINNNITLNRIVTLFYGVGIVLGVFAIWLFLVFS